MTKTLRSLTFAMLLCGASAASAFAADNGLITFSRLAPDDLTGQVAVAAPEADADITILTSESTVNGDSTWSPDGTCISFYSERDGDAEVYVMAADGSEQTRITVYPGFDYYGVFSPDGTKLAFVSSRDGDYDIYVLDLANGAVRQLTQNNSRDFTVSWSPDGTKFAFASDRDGNYEIYVMNADGSEQTRLTDNPGEDIYTNWSPDSQRIAFATTRAGTQGRDIWIMDADGENETSLISTPASDSDPAFSPDGQFVAFASGGHIYFASASDGSDPVQVTTAANVDDRSPNWQNVNSGAPAGLCPTVTPKICGDANSDGSIKATDALVVLKKSVASPVVCPKIRCDTDTSGTVVASDALRVLRVSVGQPVELVCPDVET